MLERTTHRTPFRRTGLQTFLLMVLIGGTAPAMFTPADVVPVKRLLHSAEAYLKQHPGDPDAYYTMGRIHYLAFHFGRNRIGAYLDEKKKGELPGLAPEWLSPGYGRFGKLSEKETVDHAAAGTECFQNAIRIEPRNGLYALGYASLLDEVAKYRDQLPAQKTDELPASLQGISLTKIRESYAKALDLNLEVDSRLVWRPDAGLNSTVSYEAATALIRLAKGHENDLSLSERRALKRAKVALAKFEKLPMGPVTPIVFSLQPAAHLSDLLTPDTLVDFDLRGYGWRERWTWVKPELGILVWDPTHTGHITSARQLFGGYTFQIFRDNGYDALAALDDNGDRMLSGRELDGISVWFDRNGDGKSSPDEVIPLSTLGVLSISARATGHDGIHPTNPRGLTLQDGRVLPTWDWMVEPVRARVGVLADR